MKYVKLFEEFEQYASFQNTFKPTNEEEMSKLAPGGLPKELENIKFKFAGKKLNFGITEDNGLFKVYKWSSIYEPEEICECNDLEQAKDIVNKENN